MKTMLKPMMKAAELSITLRKSCPSFIFSCSTPTPEIRETYPGTSGSTQGERNEINPATKAASGNGKLVIFSILGLRFVQRPDGRIGDERLRTCFAPVIPAP